MIVIDASIAIKWFVDEAGREKAERVLAQIKAQPAEFAVPDLFYLEMMSVLVRLIERPAELDQVISDLFDLGMIQVRVGAKLLKEASEIGLTYKLSGYDAVYAACARALGGRWLTADHKAHQKVAALEVSQCL